MKYILPVFFLFAAAIAQGQTSTIYDSWNPALAGSVVHITITEHEIIATHPREGFAKALPDFMALPSSTEHDSTLPVEAVPNSNFTEMSDTVQLLKIVYDSAKAKGRIFIRPEKGKGFILPLSFVLHENGEAEIGIAPGGMDFDHMVKPLTLKQVERATRPSAKRKKDLLGFFGMETLTFTFYNSSRTAEFTKMKDPAAMPKAELVTMINSFGNRMAAELQSLPVDTSANPLSEMALLGPIFKRVFRTAHELFIAHGYNPLGAAEMYDRVKDDSDIKAAMEAVGNKIEESVPALRISKRNREIEKEETMKVQLAEINAVYQQRLDLVLNLIEELRSTSGIDQKMLTEISNARSQAAPQTLTLETMKDSMAFNTFERTQNDFSIAISNIFNTIEKNNLNSQEQFNTILSQIEGQQNRVAVECERWNEFVSAVPGYLHFKTRSGEAVKVSFPPKTDDASSDPRVPDAGYEMEKRMTPAQQTPQAEDEFIEAEKLPEPKVAIQSNVEYPAEARRNGIEGSVTFSAMIGKDGTVEKVVIDKSDNKIFDQAVIDAVQKTKFAPATKDDKPVRVWYTQKVSFKLH